MIKQDILDFLTFLKTYIVSRIIFIGVVFEKIKDIIVAILIVRRGKYSNSFLNSSFFIMVVSIIIGGPVIAESHPAITRVFAKDKEAPVEILALESDIYSMPFRTSISQKSRDKVEKYEVKGGDTLDSISKLFDISVDTIKWANDIKTDTIKPGEVLDIPPITGIVHKVRSGDTVYSIAKKYKTEAQNIVNFPFNDFSDLDTFGLTVGQNIYVPNGVIEPEKPAINRPYIPFQPQIASGQQGSGSFIWPTSGIITQNPIWYHMALDIANPSAPPIIASDGGTVTYSGCLNWGYGCHIIIDHGNGYQTLYGHMSYLGVSVGQNVGKGETIGTMGSTGMSTGTHLHFEIRSGGQILNPLDFL